MNLLCRSYCAIASACCGIMTVEKSLASGGEWMFTVAERCVPRGIFVYLFLLNSLILLTEIECETVHFILSDSIFE